ncbi:MAG TPA: cytochrome c biogenesis CcdA family protein [Burkholderiaceae bacterium]|nr:cytochrome c biogenesis CcdA family protein [Burkholderiaceae bacterium]
MEFGPATFALGYLAGLLSTLSPCVLPLLPILLASAVGAHRHGPVALALGLALSFSLVGLFLATLGASLGLEASTFRARAAVILIAFAAVLLSTRLQQRFALATAGLSGAGDSLLARVRLDGLAGQLVIGLVLGIVWSPCVGPTLGAATTLASQGRDLTQIALLMLLFGFGAATPLVVLGSLSRATVQRLRGRLLAAGKGGKVVLGVLLLAVGVAILTGWDKRFEAWAVDVSPAWLTELTTRY